MARKKKTNYTLAADQAQTIAAPVLPYQPRRVRRLNRPIGLIGCGGISASHLQAYAQAGYNVVALCDRIPERAQERRDTFYPDADTYTDYRQLLERDDIEVVDIATHPQDRDYLIPAALRAGKHVLSQKPFVLNLDKGRRFADLAEANGVMLAVNQNGRWSPYYSYIRQAVSKGLIGEVMSIHLACHWSHEWIHATHFNRVHHIILYDYAIHWFDMMHCLANGKSPKRVTASLTHAPGQKATPPLLGQAMIEFDNAQATLVFDGSTRYGSLENVVVVGTKGTITASGPVCAIDRVTLETKKGRAQAELKGHWFVEGFQGAMAELLWSIENRKTPVNTARDNLNGLAACFAAIVSAETGKPQLVGKVRKPPVERCRVAEAAPDSA